MARSCDATQWQSVQVRRTRKISHCHNVRTPEPRRADLDMTVGAYQAFMKAFPQHDWQVLRPLNIGNLYKTSQRYESAAATLEAYLKQPQYADRKETAQRPLCFWPNAIEVSSSSIRQSASGKSTSSSIRRIFSGAAHSNRLSRPNT